MSIGITLRGSASGRARWWPADAIYAADFIARRYMINGVEVPAAQAFSFSRASARLAEDALGDYVEFAVNEPAITSLGLSLEPQRSNLNSRLRHSNSSGWVSNSTATVTPYPGVFANIFNDAGLTASGGSLAARRETPTFEVAAGTTYSCTFWYRAGSSGKVKLSCRAGSDMSGWSGSLTNLDTKAELAGTVETVHVVVSPSLIHRANFNWSPIFSSSGVRLGIGPNSTLSGEDVLVLGCQIEAYASPTSPISNSGTIVPRESDRLVLMLPNSSQTLNLRYASGVTQVAVSSLDMTLPVAATELAQIWATN